MTSYTLLKSHAKDVIDARLDTAEAQLADLSGINPTTIYLRTAYRVNGENGAPAKFGSVGEIRPTQLIVDNSGAQQRIDFCVGGVSKWLAYRDNNDEFAIWNHTTGDSFRINPDTNRVNFSTTPQLAGRDIVAVGSDGKLPALDGSKLTNVPSVLLQSKLVTYTAQTSISTAIPFDNTKPQISEGVEIISTTFTPKSATSKIRARLQAPVSPLGNGRGIAALFANGASDAICATSTYHTNSASACMTMVKEIPHSTTDFITISVRAGTDGISSSITFNAISSVGPTTLGGIMQTTLEIEEYAS